ncbi:NH(3)-dependent NAD(+) synthetase [bacterium HR08]|nr:NH(3)-dependent NAD(+) synthetase [bacterium HR08]
MAFEDFNPALAAELLVRFIREEVTKVGFERGVLGLSGGLDSSVVAHLTARALGPENTYGVLMPYRTSDPAGVADAQMVADQLGIRTIRVEITPMVDAYFEHFPDADRIRRGNAMARMRMLVLYDLSAALRALVIGTSNKTELLVGYGTIYGDMAAAMWPLGDLYKTEVRRLAQYLGVPARILEKPPTADLWVGQSDEEELGITYEVLDALLVELVDRRRPLEALVEDGHDEALVRRVAEMVRRSQFKRRTPLCPKISSRSIGHDFRYKRDWGN